MRNVWLSVVIAAFFEVGWAVGLKHANGTVEWLLTAFSIIVSFYLMLRAGQKLAVGTVYAVFVGLGTTGTVLADIILFGAPLVLSKCILIMILLIGVILLKVVDQHKNTEVI